jgi:hypothetical protein
MRIQAPGFDLLTSPEQETVIHPDADSPPVIFDLCPVRVGSTRVTFDFFQGGNPLGTVSLPVDITAYQVSTPFAVTAKQSLRINPAAEPPDLLLYVSYERNEVHPVLTFTLQRRGEVGVTFRDVPLQGDPQAQASQFYDQLTVLTSQGDPTSQSVKGKWRRLPPEDIDRRLKQFGQNLWRNLIPEELKIRYAAEREAWRDRSLVVVSDEPYIPWELVWPYGRGWEDENPWCLRLCLTRWLRRDAQGNGHEAPPTRLPFGALACLAPSDANLPAAQQESQFLQDLVVQSGLADLSPSACTWKEVLDLLESGNYDWLHAAAHGNFYPESPDSDSAIWLQDEYPLTPNAFVGYAIEDYIHAQRPGFVFNACHSGREGWILTRLGGWSNRLISSGAGLFIGPLWTVDDEAAFAFAETFYRQLVAGKTVGKAVQQARLAARRPGDPTWLAYSVYSHPNARVSLVA